MVYGLRYTVCTVHLAPRTVNLPPHPPSTPSPPNGALTLETFDFDVVIIGGGPAGCSCALYTARASLKTVVLDKNPAVGALAITHKIANYPGVAGDISGKELLAVMRQQAVDFGAVYQRSQVYDLDLSGEAKLVYTPEGIFRGRALVLATGAMGRTASFRVDWAENTLPRNPDPPEKPHESHTNEN